MEPRALVFADDPEAKPRLFACRKCRRSISVLNYGGNVDAARLAAEQCCVPPPPPHVRHCACGTVLADHFRTRCEPCRIAAIVAKATVTEETPDIVCIVGTDAYFEDLDEAAEQYPGAWAHPCNRVPLGVDPKKLADVLVERAIEIMCEDTFEDAEEMVGGANALGDAIERALVAFNDAQTASSWDADLTRVYRLPDAPAIGRV